MSIRRKNTVSRKDEIIEQLKQNGCRITRQRKILIDIILENDCASCKEIFYKASQEDRKIGAATVYRMINALEEIGAIKTCTGSSAGKHAAAKADARSSWRMIRFSGCQKRNWTRSSGMAPEGAVIWAKGRKYRR